MNKSKQTYSHEAEDDEIDLRELFRALWADKWLIGGVTLLATVIALITAMMLPNIYRAEALLAPNDQDRAGGISALGAQYGGLASLAGIDLSSGKSDKTALGLEILKSRKFISEFIERHAVLVPLIAADGWNAETDELLIDPDAYDPELGKWVRNVSFPKKTVPSLQEAYDEFIDILSVNTDKSTGFVTVAIEYYSPTLAKQWVDWLIDDLNDSVMRKDVSEAEQAIEYLNMQVGKTSLSDLQTVFFTLIEEQTKTIMLARVSDEYLLKTIDPAVVPELKESPKRALIVVFGALLGGLVGIVISLVRRGGRSNSHS